MTPGVNRPAKRKPIPPGFRLNLAVGVTRPGRDLVVGGTPTRILRLSQRGSRLVDAWSAGEPVSDDPAAGLLARRLVDTGIADPVPPTAASPQVCAVAFAIPVRDDAEGLRQTLSSVYQTASRAAVVVVDDASVSPLQDTLWGYKPPAGGDLSLLRRARRGGPAAARNTAWCYLAGREVDPDVSLVCRRGEPALPAEIVVFVDAGVTGDPGWLEVLLAHFADPQVGAVAPRVRSRSAQGTPALLGAYECHRSPLDRGVHPGCVAPGRRVSYVPSAALAVRVSCLAEVGGFDEDLRYGEDVDLVWRLSSSGWVVRYEPRAEVSHPARTSWRAWVAQRYSYGRSAGPLALRHPGAAAPLAVSPWSVACWALLSSGRVRLAGALTFLTPLIFAWRSPRADSGRRYSRTGRRHLPQSGAPDGSLRLEVAWEMFRLAVRGNVLAAAPISSAVRRAWGVPVLAAWLLARPWMRARTRRFAAVTAVAVAVGPGLADRFKHHRHGPGLAAWCVLRLADDLAYQAGVWAGSLESRSPAALLPRSATAKCTSPAARPV